MRIHVLYGQRCGITGKGIAETLRSNTSERITSGHSLDHDVDLLIRWGSTVSVYGSYSAEFNSVEGINNAADKKAMLLAFYEHNVACPKFWMPGRYNEIVNFPVIVRRRDHYKGHGFYLVRSQDELRQYNSADYYAVKQVNVAEEFRVFVYKGTIFEINKKIRDNAQGSLNPLIHNLDNGWVCRRGGFEIPDGIRSVARAAANAVELDFGACDVYVDTNGNIGCFEINSAPGLVQRKLDKLIGKIVEDYTGGEL